MFNTSTTNLTNLISTHLTSLGFPGVTSGERWEGDGVIHVGPPPQDPDRHWYLWVSGNDNEYYPPGISLVLINPKGTHDDVIEIEDFSHLESLLTQHNYLPLS